MKPLLSVLVVLLFSHAACAALKKNSKTKSSVAAQTNMLKAEEAARSGDLDGAMQALDAALSEATTEGDFGTLGRALYWRSKFDEKKGDSSRGSVDAQAAADAFMKADLTSMAVAALIQKAFFDETRGQMADAKAALTDARKLAMEHKLGDEISHLSCSLVRICTRMGLGIEAQAALADAEAQDPTSEGVKAEVLLARARYNGAFGDSGKALAAYLEALPSLVRLGNVHEAANAHFNAAALLGTSHRFDDASDHLENAVSGFTRMGELSGVGMTLSLQAWHLIQQGRLDAAEPLLHMAAKELTETKYVERLAENDERYAHYWQQRKEPGKAHECAERAAVTFSKMGQVQRAKAVRAAFPKTGES